MFFTFFICYCFIIMIELKEKRIFTMKNTIDENLLNNLSMDKTIGDNIKQFRKDKGLSQKALGNKIGVSQQMIAQYESNKREPKLQTLVKIATALDIPVFYLLSNCSDVVLDEKDLKFLRENNNSIEIRTKNSDFEESFLNYLTSIGLNIEIYNDSSNFDMLKLKKRDDDDFIVAISDPSRDTMIFLRKDRFNTFMNKIENFIYAEINYLYKLNI